MEKEVGESSKKPQRSRRIEASDDDFQSTPPLYAIAVRELLGQNMLGRTSIRMKLKMKITNRLPPMELFRR